MIVNEQPDSFVMITQHDHAQVSGQLAAHWCKDRYGSEWWSDTVYAIYHHDNSWIKMDAVPLWYDKKQQPYNFMDFPLVPKLVFYKLGLDEIEMENAYAALLCSMHYCSFFQQTTRDEVKEFLVGEHERQQRIKHRCGICFAEQQVLLDVHFHLLQFFDDASLYTCFNQPGTSKQDEYAWYKEGFRSSVRLPDMPKIVARWKDEKHISFAPFPFETAFAIQLPLKEVSKSSVCEKGIAAAYEDASMQYKDFSITYE